MNQDPKKFAIELVDKFYVGLHIKDYKTARNCAIFTCHQRIQETLTLTRIKFLKEVITEIEKL
jgi:hypothetical protein